MFVNAQYNTAAPDSPAAKIAGRQRRKMFSAFLEAADVCASDSVLDVGVTRDRSYDHSGREFFADEENLNLLSRQNLAQAARAAGIVKFRIKTVALLGLPTNLLLIAHKG